MGITGTTGTEVLMANGGGRCRDFEARGVARLNDGCVAVAGTCIRGRANVDLKAGAEGGTVLDVEMFDESEDTSSSGELTVLSSNPPPIPRRSDSSSSSTRSSLITLPLVLWLAAEPALLRPP